ncbi:hypothetical protein KDH_23340 [Dictyobacter sp. S3.2.2.5]|uniref:Uncharacterized protein n=1 Tax=Dictyobacter halimunensis TaxID=3026934 RepID=A0ABQ6FP78_9CHLR|nr:hypothetical protein KDH_23340 [Dictyobacter sp. S3.2.2.5]
MKRFCTQPGRFLVDGISPHVTFGFVCGAFVWRCHVGERVRQEKRCRGGTWAAIAGARGPVDR